MSGKTQPAKEDWQAIERCLCYPGAADLLVCDGFEVTIRVERDHLRMVLMLYIDGQFKGVWLSDDCEQRRRFMRPVKRYVYGKKLRAEARKPGKIQIYKEMFEDVNKQVTYYHPWWTSFASLRRHLAANNESITWVRDEA